MMREREAERERVHGCFVCVSSISHNALYDAVMRERERREREHGCCV